MLFKKEKVNSSYSLFVALNSSPNNSEFGLKELRFVNLTEISKGQVFFQDNSHLCYEESIIWDDINPNTPSPVNFNIHKSAKLCPPCHMSCYNNVTGLASCWGEGPNMCQKLTRKICHGNCASKSRCYGNNSNECCSPECAGGCTGPHKNECFACQHFKDNGECEPSCPKPLIYDKSLMMNVKNPNAKYQFGPNCVDSCPTFMLQDSGSCVKKCTEGKHAADNRNCENCVGPCPRTCKGFEEGFLNLTALHLFEDCTSIDGSLRILKSSFERRTVLSNSDLHFKIEGIHPHNLSVLQHVKEITGYLLIQASHPEFTDLGFLSSLETIHGRNVHMSASLDIMSTPLKSLDLKSLKYIRNGNVNLLNNKELCFAHSVNWSKLFMHENQRANLKFNRNPQDCQRENETCDPQCHAQSGCWGKGPTKCIACAAYFYEEESLCLAKCSDKLGLYHKSNFKCEKCHEQCDGSCKGPSNSECDKCKYVSLKNKNGYVTCEAQCPESLYPDEDKVCQPCHPFCHRGCTGPNETVGPGGCNACELGIRKSDISIIRCLAPTPKKSVECDTGFFHIRVTTNSISFPVCENCDELCITCTAASTHNCEKCRYFRHDRHCVKECPSFYFANNVTNDCEMCHTECRGGCSGPTTADCKACSNFKIYFDAEQKLFNCTSKCPTTLPYNVKDHESDENRVVCADGTHPDIMRILDKSAEEEKKKVIIFGVTIPAAVILLLIIIFVSYFCYKRARNNMKAAEYTAKITGVEEIEPLTPTNAKPDLSQMRIINEEELRKGAIIGSGAFGTVYKGIWIPHGENVKIPVAIKILQEGTSPGQSTELLEEARVMCSVEHICCVRILAVCLKYQMMLVTQLMPHGNLLNYVRDNAQHIGSKALLNWCTQIARGMAYLEDRGIVHRDLAARNVLVQTPNQVKITDFGLAKLLDSDADVYQSSGGLMPIKWLALECINHRIFTHKSDVWSFGITLWELFTLGKKPYENVRTKDVPMLLEKGERLQQPSMCTIDVYMIMVKCWMLEAESRPSFRELVDEFAKMSRDPGRYLVIEGDSLMRLPSVSYDKNELVHGITDGPESVMEAEEYLMPVDNHRLHRPVSLARQQSNMSTSSQSRIMVDPSSRLSGAKAMKPERDGQKIREKKYGHLNAAARAKQEREEQPNFRGDSINSRYSSDPIKYNKDRDEIDWAIEGPFQSYGEYPNSPQYVRDPRMSKMSPSVLLPVDKDDYLQPGAAAQSLAYLDLDGKGYYQNEKDAQSEDPFDETDPMMNHPPTSPSVLLHNGSKHAYTNYQPRSPHAVENAVNNPVYFDGGRDVWESKWSMRNGYHAVPNVSMSPVHSNKDKSESYYKSMNGNFEGSPNSSPVVNTKVTMAGVKLDDSESKV
ncbi:unnamed protein product [Lymnaea stagnalis]|uniref:Receptor protein-tyrosine kinase n=1 Tax=Lymnaea stagnalis TaxID=6523 RepID=A0AAV2IG45_LYMST